MGTPGPLAKEPRGVTPHQFQPTFSDPHICASCGWTSDTVAHRLGLRDRVGIDYVKCPGCDTLYPVEHTVRMYGRGRVCRECAGFAPPNPFADLAVKLARGYITEEQYLKELERLEHDG